MAMNSGTGQDIPAAVRGLPIFEGVSDDALEELASMARCHDYPRNNILFYQGDPTGNCFLVVRGRVKLSLMNEEGREVVLTLVPAGGIIGLISALDGEPQPGNAITVADSRLARFDCDALVGWLERQNLMQRSIVAELGRRVREAYQKIGEHALMAVRERLLFALIDIAEREGTPEPESQVIVFTRPTHQELANRIGSSREVVSRVLKELLESELLQAEGRVIRVPESALVLRED